ncbi:hypothetical protein GCM10007231_16060 [Nocardioides daphniae]|uniref:DUF559 domain-containing protein n=1 Tax=Nocardioides daphniae TaxID=402297 RepID=A0ABQ1Q9F7_9ACTN|nr:hypothetical protein GCM10007231_16060 [Nocardioides daphniae]
MLADGLQPHDVKRLVRRRDLVPVHRGVYVTHTGDLTWRQQAWAGALALWPAALWGPSALAAMDAREPVNDTPLHLAVDHERRVAQLTGVVLHRVVGLEPRVRWSASPPRMHVEEAALDVAVTAGDEFAAVAALADVVQRRLTTPARLSATLDRRVRLAHRGWLTDVLADLEEGSDSVLEHRYLVRVERRHGLPHGRRQARLPGAAAVHDVLYEGARVIVELDGRAHHSLARDRFADLDRDAVALLAGHVTVRLGWGQVVGQPCRTAARLAALLAQRGWEGSLRPCPDC